MIRRILSHIAWRRFQSRVRKARDAARRSHKATRQINARQTATVNAALRACVRNQGG